MRMQIPYNLHWLVPTVMLLFSVHIALCENPPTVNIIESLIHAVEEDNNEAYRAARSVALELDDREFDALLESLDKTGTWQALAVKGGLRIRRKNPNLAAEFDEIVDWVRNNPALTASGAHRFRGEKFREDFDTSEGDWLRYEAILTEMADLPTDGTGIPGWLEFRRVVFDGGARHADDMRFRIMLLRDMPEWLSYGYVLGGLPASIRRSSDKVDAYVPELVGHYMRIRQEMINDPKAPVHIQPRPTISTFYRIMEAIAEADADVSLPALKQIRKFELMTGADIESTLKNQGAKPWHNPQLEVLLGKVDELIEKHQEAGDN